MDAAERGDDLAGLVLAERYKLDEKLGSGGMGRVYRGEHLALALPIAVKLMHPWLVDDIEAVARFKREAHAAGLLQHRNVVRVFDVGEAMGLHYIVMEFLDGMTLGEFLDQVTPIPVAEAVSIVDGVLAALEAAHAMGVVHRDLKPENIFLMLEPGGARVVKVVDFGLAHVETPKSEGLTKADAVAGTPKYMSPEQCRSLAVGPSTDLYAVGCILTELLQGAPPFEAPTSMDVIAKQLFQPPGPLRRSPSADPVPELLERLRLDLLAKSPERRPNAAKTVRARLAEAMNPTRAAQVLPSRPADAGRLAREGRSPVWENRETARPPGNAGPGRRLAVIHLGRSADGLHEEHLLALLSKGVDAKRLDASLSDAPPDVDAVVLDVGDEVEAVEHWLEARPAAARSVPVVACVAKAGPDRLRRLIAAGVADVVAYPVEVDVLQKRVERVLRRGR